MLGAIQEAQKVLDRDIFSLTADVLMDKQLSAIDHYVRQIRHTQNLINQEIHNYEPSSELTEEFKALSELTRPLNIRHEMMRDLRFILSSELYPDKPYDQYITYTPVDGLLRKLQVLYNADYEKLIGDAIERKFLSILNEYIRQVEAKLDVVPDVINKVEKTIDSLKRGGDRITEQVREQYPTFDPADLTTVHDPLMEALEAYSKNKDTLLQDDDFSTDRQYLAIEYYEEWETHRKQLQELIDLQIKLRERLDSVKAEYSRLAKLPDMRIPSAHSSMLEKHAEALIRSIRDRFEREAETILQRVLDEEPASRWYGDLKQQLEERKRRLLRRDSDDDNE